MPRRFIFPAAITLVIGLFLFSPVEQYRFSSPDERYTAVVSSYRLWILLPTLAGPHQARLGPLRTTDNLGERLASSPYPGIPLGPKVNGSTPAQRTGRAGPGTSRIGSYASWTDDHPHPDFPATT